MRVDWLLSTGKITTQHYPVTIELIHSEDTAQKKNTLDVVVV